MCSLQETRFRSKITRTCKVKEWGKCFMQIVTKELMLVSGKVNFKPKTEKT